MNMAPVIQYSHDSFASIKCGPENICTFCDQLWYDHQLQKAMIINAVHQVHKNLSDVCMTGKASVDNTEWVSLTCHSNLSDKKLNFTPLEERLKSLCIPFRHANNIM